MTTAPLLPREAPVFDAGYLDELSAGDRAFEAHLLDVFQASAHEVIPALGDALGDANVALAEGLAHRLKGASLTVGAAALAAVAADLEAFAHAGSLGDARTAFARIAHEHARFTGVLADRLAPAA